jgi:hypothetical protein
MVQGNITNGKIYTNLLSICRMTPDKKIEKHNLIIATIELEIKLK